MEDPFVDGIIDKIGPFTSNTTMIDIKFVRWVKTKNNRYTKKFSIDFDNQTTLIVDSLYTIDEKEYFKKKLEGKT